MSLGLVIRTICETLSFATEVRKSLLAIWGVAVALIVTAILADFARYMNVEFLDNETRIFLSLGHDRGLPETYGYILTATSVLLYFGSFRASGLWVFLFWSLVHAYVFLDDAFQFHEFAGGWISSSGFLSGLLGKIGQSEGELIAFGMIGLLLLVPLGLCLKRLKAVEIPIYVFLGSLFLLLAFFGAVVDFFHDGATGLPRRILGWTEDGGELLAMAAVTSSAILYFHQRHQLRKA